MKLLEIADAFNHTHIKYGKRFQMWFVISRLILNTYNTQFNSLTIILVYILFGQVFYIISHEMHSISFQFDWWDVIMGKENGQT